MNYVNGRWVESPDVTSAGNEELSRLGGFGDMYTRESLENTFPGLVTSSTAPVGGGLAGEYLSGMCSYLNQTNSGIAGQFKNKLGQSINTGNYGGSGTYGYYEDPTTGDRMGLNKEAYDLMPKDGSVVTGVNCGSGDDFWTLKGGGGLAVGGLQTGIGLMGTLDAMKTAGLQRKLLGQQYDTNAEKMANWRSNTANVKNAFGGGLAASGVKP